MKGFKDTTKMRPVHDLSVKGPVGGVEDFHSYGPDHALVQRQTPATEELKEAGGTSPLRAGFAKGGPTHKHFHVHHHHHAKGGSVETTSKSYRHVERKAASRAERKGPDERPHVKDSTRTPRDRFGEGGAVTEAQLDHAIGMKRGGKSKRKSAGGAVYAKGGSTTGGTRNRLALGGMPSVRPTMGRPVLGGRPGVGGPAGGIQPPGNAAQLRAGLSALAGTPMGGTRPPLAGPMRRPMPVAPGPMPANVRARGGRVG